jgi:hypothetical protein
MIKLSASSEDIFGNTHETNDSFYVSDFEDLTEDENFLVYDIGRELHYINKQMNNLVKVMDSKKKE